MRIPFFAAWIMFGSFLPAACAASASPDGADGATPDAPAGSRCPSPAATATGATDAAAPPGSRDAQASPPDTGMDAGRTADASDEARGAMLDAGADGSTGLSYMVGIKTNGSATGPAKVEGWLGRPLDVAGTTITTTSYIGAGAAYVTASGSHPLLEVSFPLLSIFGESNGLGDLAEAASGAYDSTYEAMSQALAASPNALLSARIGWELNGSWYAWSNGVGTNATYANYVSAFQHAAKAIRKYNPKALIQWNIAWGQPDPTPYWPGAYDASMNPGGVDVVSIDFYQANISQYNNGGNQSSWAMAQSGSTVNVDWMVSFAKDKGVRIALSEYGAGSPGSGGAGSGAGLDDGAWTAGAISWMSSQPVGFFLWTCWSDDAPADDIVTNGANPDEQAAWRSAWGGTHFAGSWWP